MKFEKLTPGMVLYDRHKQRAGNTTMSALGEWPVRIIEIDPPRTTESGRPLPRSATVSWNHNRPERWYADRLERLKTWSMYDKDELARRGMERVEGVVGTVAVRKIRRTDRGER